MKLIVCDPIAPAAVKAMKKAGIKVDVQDDITPEDLETVIADYDAMVVRSRTKVRQPLIDKAPRLKLVIRRSDFISLHVPYTSETHFIL